MLVEELKAGFWYLYKGRFVVEYCFLAMDGLCQWWRFYFLTKSSRDEIDLWEDEVHTCIKPIDSLLEQYLLLFR